MFLEDTVIDEEDDDEDIVDVNDFMEESDDSEDLMNPHSNYNSDSEISDCNSEPTTTQFKPEVIVFQDVAPNQSLYGTKKQKRVFMSSKTTQFSELPSTEIPLRAPKKPRINLEEKTQDAADDQHDKDLGDLLRTTKLIEKYNAADLEGGERRAYIRSQIDAATKGKGVKTGIVHSHHVRVGIEQKRVKEVGKRLQEAKQLGVYSNFTKHLYTDKGKDGKGAKLNDDVKRSGKKSKNGGVKGGLTGSIGKYRDGTLYIGKKDIEDAGRGVKGNFGIVKRSFENVNRPKSNQKGNKKRKR